MKTLKKCIMVILGVVFAINFAAAQNYKAPKIDASGKITDKDGKHIGGVNTNGDILDTLGIRIGYVDASGMLIDTKTGKKLGKAEKNGNYLYYTAATKDGKTLSTTAPVNGICYVKTASGKVVMEVHENYKMYGACAIHCLENQMNHDEIVDKNKPAATTTHTCPMHPDVVSDKAAKCSKCGMDLMKK